VSISAWLDAGGFLMRADLSRLLDAFPRPRVASQAAIQMFVAAAPGPRLPIRISWPFNVIVEIGAVMTDHQCRRTIASISSRSARIIGLSASI
jgi:hypothetical protein